MTLEFFSYGWHSLDAWWWPYVFILVAGFLANDVWRILGVALAGRVREDSEVFGYVRAVATALVAGVIAQLVLQPSGGLATSPLALRLAAVAVGFTVYKLARDNVLVGVVAGVALLVAGLMLLA